MNPVRYWVRVITAANPKEKPYTLEQSLNCLIGNVIVALIVASFGTVFHIMLESFPLWAPVTATVTLALTLFMFISLCLRMRKVSKWRYKMEKPAE